MKRKLIAIILCVAMLIPCAMLNTFAEETANVDSGKVLYNQEFGESFGNNDLSDSGLTEYTKVAPSANGSRHFVEITDEGILQVRTTNNRYFLCLSIPESTAPEHDTYTVEIKFSFRPNASNNSKANGRFGFAWGDISDFNAQSNYSQVTVNYTSEGNTANLPFNTDENFEEVRNAWSYTGTSYLTSCGPEVTMKVSLNGGYLNGVYFECNNIEWSSMLPTDTETNFSGDIGMYIGDCCVDIYSIKVVEGTSADIDEEKGYTEADLHGQFATKSYSDFYNTDVISTGIQPTVITSQEIRLVAEIKGLNFKAAGFRVSITYTDANADDPTAPITKSNDMVAHCAYLSLSARGENNEIAPIAPEKGGDYLIAIAIEGIEERYTITSVTFTPYAINADGHTYIGKPYTYDYATQSVVAQ